jgi:anti-sigma regulatory factor (Ser/Thr protein kinase)
MPLTRTTAPGCVARTYPGMTSYIRAVRADLRGLLGDCPALDDVVLCASELATNAVRHSRSGLRGGSFTLRVTVARGVSVRVDVQDDGGPWTPALAAPDRHHGLDIVGALAAELAITGDHRGRTVSAVLSWTPSLD